MRQRRVTLRGRWAAHARRRSSRSRPPRRFRRRQPLRTGSASAREDTSRAESMRTADGRRASPSRAAEAQAMPRSRTRLRRLPSRASAPSWTVTRPRGRRRRATSPPWRWRGQAEPHEAPPLASGRCQSRRSPSRVRTPSSVASLRPLGGALRRQRRKPRARPRLAGVGSRTTFAPTDRARVQVIPATWFFVERFVIGAPVPKTARRQRADRGRVPRPPPARVPRRRRAARLGALLPGPGSRAGQHGLGARRAASWRTCSRCAAGSKLARSVRIIAGSRKGATIYAPKGADTRPTGDRVREAAFNLIGPVDGASVLDLYAGSGAMGSRRSRAGRRAPSSSRPTARRARRSSATWSS